MAQHVQVLLVDDLDGSTAEETVTFGLDGVTYEIDLSGDHAEELRQGLANWLAVARRQTARQTKPRVRKPVDKETAKIRAWAREQGYDVSDRGRVPASIREAYHAAK
ncbi:MAG: Lsr2 family protein [Bifidobacteriaceae bacterium]|jgi:hypothetical protein|nr:Lsr2 family protein [Bifidobacteriaceae bacterium]